MSRSKVQSYTGDTILINCNMSQVFRLVVILIFLVGYTSAWDNEYDRPLHRECPSGQVLYMLISQHNSRKEDRVWTFYCKSHNQLSGGQVCEWKNNVNSLDAVMDFNCPSGYVITGASSWHDSRKEDRVWNYKCCKPCDIRDFEFLKV